jgi:hypothetical protein
MGLVRINTLAYLSEAAVTENFLFIKLSPGRANIATTTTCTRPGANVTKLFSFVADDEAY